MFLNAVTLASSSTAAGGAVPVSVGWAAACAAGAAVAPGFRTACWLPMTQPASRPKSMPAMPYAIDSDFIIKKVSPRRTQLLSSVSSVVKSSYRSYKNREVFAHDGLEADKERARHDRVPDRHFVQMRERAEHRQILEVEVVAGVHAKAEGLRSLRGFGI